MTIFPLPRLGDIMVSLIRFPHKHLTRFSSFGVAAFLGLFGRTFMAEPQVNIDVDRSTRWITITPKSGDYDSTVCLI